MTSEASFEIRPATGFDADGADRLAPTPDHENIAPSEAITAEASSIHPSAAPLVSTLRARRPNAPIATALPSRAAPPRRVIGAVCAVLLATLTLAGRERIVTRLPATDRIFAAIGLPVNLAGVEFRNVASKIAEIDGQKVLAVTGEIVNLRSAAAAAVPGLKLTARGADGRPLYVWTTNAATSKLAPGETTTFRSRLAAPPDEAREVVVSLADAARVVAQADPPATASKGRLTGK